MQVQLHIVAHQKRRYDEPPAVDSLRAGNVHASAALARDQVDCLLDRLRVVREAVAFRAEFRDRHRAPRQLKSIRVFVEALEILNVKPVDGTTKPISKPVHKPEDEEEEVKKTTPTKEVEKEKEKEVHTEEKKEKKKVHEIDDEIEDDDDKKSVLDDKETPEEEEVIKKDKEIEKEEKGEDEEKDDDEKKKTNESVAPVQEYPNVKTLGDGEYDGILWGHCFLYEDQKYYSEIGWMNMFPGYCKMIIEGDEVFPKPVDKYQRESLKKLFL